MKRLIFLSLLSGVLASSTGCGLMQAIFCYRPCAMRGDCGGGPCIDGCDDGCGEAGCGAVRRPVRAPAYGPRVAHGTVAACDTGCDADCGVPCGRGRPCGRANCGSCNSCDPCSDPCNGRCWNRGPITWVFALFMPRTWTGGGCGERYWGDFYSDPPDCWDPCDNYGNYTGSGVSSGAGSGGCRSCGRNHASAPDYTEAYPSGGRAVVDEAMPIPKGGKIVSQDDRVVSPAPTPMAEPHRATKP